MLHPCENTPVNVIPGIWYIVYLRLSLDCNVWHTERETQFIFNSKETFVCYNLCLQQCTVLFFLLFFNQCFGKKKKKIVISRKANGIHPPHPPKMRCKHCRQLPPGWKETRLGRCPLETLCVWLAGDGVWPQVTAVCVTGLSLLCPSLPLMAVAVVTVYPFLRPSPDLRIGGGGG